MLPHPEMREYSLFDGVRRFSAAEFECVGRPTIHVMEVELPSVISVSTPPRREEYNGVRVL